MRFASSRAWISGSVAVLLAALSLTPAPSVGNPLVHEAELAQSNFEKGGELYLQNCAACHQSDGQGLPGAFPPLAKSDFIAANPAAVLEVTINGLQGKLVVNGQEYNNSMPAMSYLNDEDLSLIITYVLNSWGNPGGRISRKEVNAYRTGKGLEVKQATGQRHQGVRMEPLFYSDAIDIYHRSQGTAGG